MNYSTIIKTSKEKVSNYAIATKILDLMDKLRLNEDMEAKRRWIWELLQNAKDVKYPDKEVHIELEFNTGEDGKYLEFRHTGQPFSIDNLTFLIEQVSTKERNEVGDNKPKQTGKFGTGFLTTHLLSEVVNITGYIKEAQLPFKYFETVLDRRGKTIHEVLNSITHSLEVLNTIEIADASTDFDENRFNTKFRYQLDQEGISVAETGLEDLYAALPYTLLFLPEIATVKLTTDNRVYKRGEITWSNGEIDIQTVHNTINDCVHTVSVAVLKGKRVTIAIPVELMEDERIVLQGIPPTQPRLYCDFPLIGSEDFEIPFIINSSFFNPNEPRNGIFLSDRDDERIVENKELLTEALALYRKFINHASLGNWKNTFYLAALGDAPKKPWLSKNWYETALQKPLYEILSLTPLVDTLEGNRKSILSNEKKPQVWFPAAPKDKIRENLWKLCADWVPSSIPNIDEVHDWYNVLWEDCSKITVAALGKWISGWKNLDTVSEQLQNEIDSIDWLNKYYQVVNEEGKFIDEVVGNKVAVLPNQRGDFKLQSELYFDNNIDDAFKDILGRLGEDIRKELRHRKIVTNNKLDKDAETQIRHNRREPEYVIGKINKVLSKRENANCLPSAIELLAISPRNSSLSERRKTLYNITASIFEVPEWTQVSYGDESIWIEADKVLIDEFINAIASNKNVKAFALAYDFTEAEAISWLNDFVGFLTKYEDDHYLNIPDKPILPNQQGEFIAKDSVFLDDGTIDEILKDICEILGSPLRKELLDKNIFLQITGSRTLDQQKIAERITALVFPRFSEVIRSTETKKAFQMLSIWFQRNKEDAESIFYELYAGRHKLYDDDEVVANMQKAEDLQQIMDEFNVSDLQDLRNRIIQSVPEEKEQLLPITQETLVSLGIGSVEELQEAMKDINLSQSFSHASTPTVEMFLYAQSLITRAKKNILEFLKTLPDYNCDEAEEVAPTVLGGIYHHGFLINVVCRPSDNGEVIIYYSSEKDTLELPESELWIDSGVNSPLQLTIGKILKDTGISRIPVKL